MFCKYCGKEMEEGSRFCFYCGKKLVTDNTNNTENTTNSAEPSVEKTYDHFQQEKNAEEEPIKEDADVFAEKETEATSYNTTEEASKNTVKDTQQTTEKNQKYNPVQSNESAPIEYHRSTVVIIFGIIAMVIFFIGGKIYADRKADTAQVAQEQSEQASSGNSDKQKEDEKEITSSEALEKLKKRMGFGGTSYDLSLEYQNRTRTIDERVSYDFILYEQTTGMKVSEYYISVNGDYMREDDGNGGTKLIVELTDPQIEAAIGMKKTTQIDEVVQAGTVAGYEYEYWKDQFERQNSGPSSDILIYDIDQSGVTYSASIGGALSYRDVRNIKAEWLTNCSAQYVYGDYTNIINFFEDGTFSIEEIGETSDMLSFSGTYEKRTINNDSRGYVIPDSNTRYISESELYDFNALECKIARNEIFARYGRMFNDGKLQAYFDTCDWYTERIAADSFSDDILNQYEKKNAETISNYESKMGYK